MSIPVTAEAVARWVGDHPDLVEVVRGVEPTWAGVAPSEMLAMLAVIRGMGLTHVVESGRYDGTSTEALLAAGLTVDSIERAPKHDRDARFVSPRLKLHEGDGVTLAPQLAGPRSALLIDGPKGVEARALGDRCRAPATFLHDFHRGQPARQGLTAWFTDDEAWVAFAGHLDNAYWRIVARDGTAWRRGPYSHGGGSYGPTLAIVTYGRNA